MNQRHLFLTVNARDENENEFAQQSRVLREDQLFDFLERQEPSTNSEEGLHGVDVMLDVLNDNTVNEIENDWINFVAFMIALTYILEIKNHLLKIK